MSEQFDNDSWRIFQERQRAQHCERMEALRRRAFTIGLINLVVASALGLIAVRAGGLLGYFAVTVAILVALGAGWMTERYRP